MVGVEELLSKIVLVKIGVAVFLLLVLLVVEAVDSSSSSSSLDSRIALAWGLAVVASTVRRVL